MCTCTANARVHPGRPATTTKSDDEWRQQRLWRAKPHTCTMDRVCKARSGWHVEQQLACMGRESTNRHGLARLACASNMDTNSASSNFSCRDAATMLDMGKPTQHGTHMHEVWPQCVEVS